MRLINQSWIYEQIPQNPLEMIERAGRTCYKSDPHDAAEFVRRIIKRGHESVLEHVNISVRMITSRSVTHELVRHRIASYSQESQRYVRYGNDMEFIRPVWCAAPLGQYGYICGEAGLDHLTLNGSRNFSLNDKDSIRFIKSCISCHEDYTMLLENGRTPQEAREVLNNSVKTEIVVTMNIRAWRHFFDLRCAKSAHPQIRALACDMLKSFRENFSPLFDEIHDHETVKVDSWYKISQTFLGNDTEFRKE